MINKTIIHCFFFFVVLINFIHAQSNADLFNVNISKILQSDFFSESQIAIDIYNLTEQKQVYELNSKLLFRPASTLKLFTTASSLLFLEDYKFKTSVYHSGEVEDSILCGNLIISGGFDPEFSSNDLDSLVREIKNYGIKKINGNLICDISKMDSLYWGEGWMWDDAPYSFSASLSSLTINDNSIYIVYSPGEVGKQAVISSIPPTSFVKFINNSITVQADSTNINITRDWINKKNDILITGNILQHANSDTIQISISSPENYFLTLFKESLTRNNIEHNGNSILSQINYYDDLEEIFSFDRDIDSVIINTNKMSDNLSAESLLRILGLKYFGPPSSAKKGINLLDSLITLTGLNPKKYRIADGSGLSFYNLISAESLTSILKYFYLEEPEKFVKLYNSLPISGYDGTLKNRMKEMNAYKKVRAKTGTISGVSNLAGYMTNKENQLFAFSIMNQNFVGSSKSAREIQDKICELIYNTSFNDK
ncbi:MAG: D-alanyl-D-alanine carboxypeptidase/D-alanyl-D-alanine-endopeptidase [Ignavibacteria bacterium]|nr:D-alanyl-D-alanine carboxypeptidase/D-alanyl-D-alanine-endopeptidase [Ignavibacteria bacterium]